MVVSFGADFLGTWISPVEFTKAWASRRKVDGLNKESKIIKTIQFASNLSLTGSNADYRFPMKSSMEAIYVTALYNAIAQKAGVAQMPMVKTGELAGSAIKQSAEALWNEKGAGLVVSGSNDARVQTVINGINLLLSNYGTTIDLENHSNQYKGIDADFAQFATDLSNGNYKAVIFYNTNPLYNSPMADMISAGIKRASLSVSFATTADETAIACQYIAPDSHYLESWNDAEPKAGLFQLTQPTISPVFKTRQAQDSLLTWAGLATKPLVDPFANKTILTQKAEASIYYLYIKNKWAAMGINSDATFNKALHDGVHKLDAKAATTPAFSANLNAVAAELDKMTIDANAIDLVLYQNVAIKDGSLSNNPWLQETPDPILNH